MQKWKIVTGFGAPFALAACNTFQPVPEPTADLRAVLEELRKDIVAAQESSDERPSNLSIKAATVVLKITATKAQESGAGLEKTPVKLSYTRTTSGTLENTITLELASACTQEVGASSKEGNSSKTTCFGTLENGEFKPGPTILNKTPTPQKK